MRIKMRNIMAGPDGVAHPGQIIDVERGRAYALIEGGHAEQVDVETPQSEVRAAPETAVLRPPARRATKVDR